VKTMLELNNVEHGSTTQHSQQAHHNRRQWKGSKCITAPLDIPGSERIWVCNQIAAAVVVNNCIDQVVSYPHLATALAKSCKDSVDLMISRP
jgi:hypothetical protein